VNRQLFLGAIISILALTLTVSCGGKNNDYKPLPLTDALFQFSSCKFDESIHSKVTCGTLHVPEDRTIADSRSISLHVAIFHSESSEPEPDPIIYLAGGPGSQALKSIPLMYGTIVKPFISNRDFIVFDQRGTPYSNPSMECTEISDLMYETLNRNNSMEDAASMSLSAISECKERLMSEGVDLSAYNTAENAADLASLRQSLGYEKWNLFGISYGTRLALTTMRDYPDGIRSVILDSSYPLQVDLYASFLPNIDRALNLLFKECIEDKICDRNYPALESSFYDVAQRLDKYPASISTTHPDTGERIRAVLNGPLFVNLIFQSLYQTAYIHSIPRIIKDTKAGNYRGVALLLDMSLANQQYSTDGMHWSVQCGDEIRFGDKKESIKTEEQHPELGYYFDMGFYYDVCEIWDWKEAHPIENEAVVSNIPTLILGGEYDPITPPTWGRYVSQGLESSFFFEFPGTGHGASISGRCPLQITRAFLENPSDEPDSKCISRMSSPRFYGN